MPYLYNKLKIYIINKPETMARSLLYSNVDAMKRIGS
jgi:hypothetical protein